MDEVRIGELKATLRREVAHFCRRDDRLWKAPVLETLNRLRLRKWRAVFFGGTLRSLLYSRLYRKRPGRPRDIDIVVDGVPLADLRREFSSEFVRETRFGGLQLKNTEWQFDVWPLEETYAFRHEARMVPVVEALPGTTFFNLEAVAAEVWPHPGRPRIIYSGDDQFFRGMAERVLEMNREENPFPQLCVVRSLLMATSLGFSIGTRLAHYLARVGPTVTDADLESVQLRHYGRLRRRASEMRTWIALISSDLEAGRPSPIPAPRPVQQSLWKGDRDEALRIRFKALDGR